jgi:tetratricopeptide (TPR) repeat protein
VPSRADELYAQALRQISAYRRAEAERVLEQARTLVLRDGEAAHGVRRDRIELTLAGVRAELGTLSDGLRLLADVEARLPAGDPLAGVVELQTGLVLWRAGRVTQAAPHLDAADRLLPESGPAAVPGGIPDRFALHLNRGNIRLGSGQVDGARADYERAAEVAVEPILTVKALMNLAYVDYVRGDIPAALAGLDRSLAAGAESEPGVLGEIRLMRADALLAAGLVAEADAELTQAVTSFASLRMVQDQAEAEALRAQVALAEGRAADAVRLAGTARRRFERRGSTVWALVAELVELQARLAAARRVSGVAGRAAELAAALRAAGLRDDAAVAALVAARALLREGRVAEAARWAAAGSARHPGERLTTRLLGSTVRAGLAHAEGAPRRAEAQLRAGLRTLHRHQATYGSLDAQTAVVRHGRELVHAGLAGALADGRPARVLAWAEEGRALASRLPPVRPPEDPEAAGLLQELRLLRMRQRQAQLAGERDAAADARSEALEHLVRERSWHASGPGAVERPADLAELRAALVARGGDPDDGAGGSLVAHLVVDDAVHAVVVTPRASQLVSLGAATTVVSALRRVTADLDTLAVRGHPARMRELVSRSLTQGLTSLDDLLWRPLSGALADGPVVLVPAGGLVAVPWTMLPGLRDRPVTVARSATAWCRAAPREARAVRAAAGAETGPVVVAAGPDLDRAHEEVTAVAGLWPGAATLEGDAARGTDVVAAAAGAAVVHLAAHGHHEPANPLFSALRLADGPLFGYDIARLAAPPRHVVLSACDLGRAVSRPGDEVLGMTAALLHAGTSAVVASVTRVNDDVACEVVVDYHRRLRGGLAPASALAGALAGRDDAPFLCFGAGW